MTRSTFDFVSPSMGGAGVKRAPWADSQGTVLPRDSEAGRVLLNPLLESLCVKVRPKGAMSSLRETVSNGLKPASGAPHQDMQ